MKYLLLPLLLIAFQFTAIGQSKDSTNLKFNLTEIDTLIENEEIYMIVEDNPEFIGGMVALFNFIRDNIQYPKEAKKKGITGTVYIRFTVEKDGSISNVAIQRSVDPILDNEAIRVIQSMPKWKPGKQRGKAVRVHQILPIKFTGK